MPVEQPRSPTNDTTRDEHIAWCKRRALEYVEHGDLAEALASFQSDLGKHPETAGHPHIVKGMALAQAGKLRSPDAMRSFIRDFDKADSLAEAWRMYEPALHPDTADDDRAGARQVFYMGAFAMMELLIPEPDELALAEPPRVRAALNELMRFLAEIRERKRAAQAAAAQPG